MDLKKRKPDYAFRLLGKIKTRKAKIGIIGLGYVGLPLAVEFARVGFRILGVDLSREKIRLLKKGKSYITDVTDNDLERFVIKKGLIKASSSYNLLKNADVVSITVPTPLKKTKDPDISYIVSAVNGLKTVFHPGILIVLESTTYPGTTRELIVAEIEELGYKVGEDFFAAYSPERVDPGNPQFKTRNIPKIIGGVTPAGKTIAYELYSTFLKRIHLVDTVEEAETAKLLENTFRAVNIGLVNEMAIMCDRMGINIWNVIEAASTKPFGFMPFYPGPGIGGHCIPLDPLYLSYRAKMYLGIAYKSNVNDLRESPSLEIYKLLQQENASVDYYDPLIPEFDDDNKKKRSITLTRDKIKQYDYVVVTTAHKKVDYKFVLKYSQAIFDTRNVYKGINSEKITRL
ncbi:MAG: hypothetical protein B5M53_02860 [Candidatus Cloacimonas sp. 4484_209]|nr:MAG: hypothetical protein B5M53_02860 [Candidatus Cloacimonas sp. 4484_209]